MTDDKRTISKEALFNIYRAERANLLHAIDEFAKHGQYLLGYIAKDVQGQWSDRERIAMALDVRGIWNIPTKTAFRMNEFGRVVSIDYELREGVEVDEGVVSILRDAD